MQVNSNAFNSNRIDPDNLALQLNSKGYAVIPQFLPEEQCEALQNLYQNHESFRKTVSMERYRFGQGEYKYWSYPLPDQVQQLREFLFPLLAPIANHWQVQLKQEGRFPMTLSAMLERCHDQDQTKPTPLLLKYQQGGFNTLHQDLFGDIHFPLQAAIFLSRPGVDYTGGEFVLTEQLPRAQSKATVLTPDKGDMVIFATNFRPVQGRQGFYRSRIRHGVSEVRSGQRYTMGLIFHDALS